MLMTLAKFQARSGAVSSLLDLARTLVEHSRTETGCLEYGCYQDTKAHTSGIWFASLGTGS